MQISTSWKELYKRAARPAVRDAYVLFLLLIACMAIISATDICTRVFAWVAAHPDTEVDSLMLAGILSALGMLIYSIRRSRELKAEVRRRALAEEEAFKLAYRDTLTDLPNRRAFNQHLAEIVATRSSDRAVGLLVVDLDIFKSINDAHGHVAGDRVLQQIAGRFRTLQDTDCSIFRLGGDEFAVLLRHRDCVAASEQIAKAMIDLASQPIIDAGLVHYLGASVGIALLPQDATDPDMLFRCADIALYNAKSTGRGRSKRFQAAMSANLLHRVWIEREMRAALGTGVFQPYFQPIVTLDSAGIVGYEMLARWLRADGDDISPEQFIPVAEETGLINELMMQLLDKTFHETRDWPPELWISVNLSPVQLNDRWIAQKLFACLVRNGFAPHRLIIEITENALISNPVIAREIIESLRNQGIRVALDDFGTGHSSLHHLRMLPFNKLKIDRSYIQAITTNEDARNLVAGIISLARHLGLKVIAEGVETGEIAAQLADLGCLEGQGWWFGRPVPAENAQHLGAQTSYRGRANPSSALRQISR